MNYFFLKNWLFNIELGPPPSPSYKHTVPERLSSRFDKFKIKETSKILFLALYGIGKNLEVQPSFPKSGNIEGSSQSNIQKAKVSL